VDFYVLDFDPISCARAYSDDHLQQAPAQLASILAASQAQDGPLRKHILARWAQGTVEWWWLRQLIAGLLAEQEYRFKVQDEEALGVLVQITPPMNTNYQCLVPRRFVQLHDAVLPGKPVDAARLWYQRNQGNACWTHRGAPKWWASAIQLALF